jgi:hypothetical protein
LNQDHRCLACNFPGFEEVFLKRKQHGEIFEIEQQYGISKVSVLQRINCEPAKSRRGVVFWEF